jgi:hypothetical protein
VLQQGRNKAAVTAQNCDCWLGLGWGCLEGGERVWECSAVFVCTELVFVIKIGPVKPFTWKSISLLAANACKCKCMQMQMHDETATTGLQLASHQW